MSARSCPAVPARRSDGVALARGVAAGLLGVLLLGAGTLPVQASSGPYILTSGGVPLDGAVVAGGTAAVVGGPGTVSVKFVLDGTYLGTDSTAPFSWVLPTATGSHALRVRAYDQARDVVARLDAAFTVSSSQPQPPPPAGGGTVRTVAELRSAVAAAHPGTVIDVADGTYLLPSRLEAAADGTAAAPITLRGGRGAVLRSSSATGDYGLHVTGDWWRVVGITVAHASKGIVLDGATDVVLDGVEVFDVGAEGVHFRACSSRGVLRRSYVHETGRDSRAYGEGVYVGSASSNWSSYACQDGRDGTHGVLVEDNVFRDVPAEGADLKEGTDSGTLRGNLFDNAGWSGANSADSAVDVKGNGWLVTGNTVTGGSGAFLEAFQTHSVVGGYGTRNVLRANTVRGSLPGVGIGLHPALANVVGCDNVVPAGRTLSNVPCS